MRKIVLLSLFLGLFTSLVGFLLFITADKRDYIKYRNDAMVFLARFVHTSSLSEHKYFDRFKELEKNLNVYMFDMWIIDESGNVVESFSSTSDFYLDWKSLPHPTTPMKLAGDKGPGIFFGKKLTGVIRLSDTPVRFLVFSEGNNYAPVRKFRRNTILASWAIVSLSIICTLAALIIYLRSRTKHVSEILARIKTGDLDARLNISKIDEVGGLMSRFNEMADEISRLVNQLRRADAVRTQLVEEIAHDLQTPIATTRNLVESIHDFGSQIDLETKDECFKTATQQLIHLQSLVDNLFYLSQATTPTYVQKFEKISIRSLARNILDEQKKSNTRKEKHIDFEFNDYTNEDPKVFGDASQLNRMIKNALENAFRFTKSKISLNLVEQNNFINIYVDDDGPGFAPELLSQFGKRPKLQSQDHLLKKSGLGSVIICSLAKLQGGSAWAENRSGGGARIVLSLPKFLERS